MRVREREWRKPVARKKRNKQVHEGMFLFLFPPKVVKTNVRKAKGDAIAIACACKQRMNSKQKSKSSQII